MKKRLSIQADNDSRKIPFCWDQKDFTSMVQVGDKIPQNILLEDEQLLMYYDIAKYRVYICINNAYNQFIFQLFK
jgi:hypothetical protein